MIGLLTLLYGAQGVTQTAQQAMASVWDIPRGERHGFAARLVRSLSGLAIIGGAFLLNSVLASLATARGESLALRIVVIAALFVANVALYTASFWVLTAVMCLVKQAATGAARGFASSRSPR